MKRTSFKLLMILLLLLLIFAAGIFIPKMVLKDRSDFSIKEISYAKNITRQLLDNPIEQILIIETVVTDKENDILTTETYLWGGIRYATVRVFYDQGAEVIWRKFFNDYEKKETVRFSDPPVHLESQPSGTLLRDEAITLFLESQKEFAWTTEAGSENICIFEHLSPEDSLFPLALWVRCGEFILKDDQPYETSGVSLPVLVDYPNHFSFYDPEKMTYRVPRDGSLYGEDIRAIFPEGVHDKIFEYPSSHSDINKLLFNKASKKLFSKKLDEAITKTEQKGEDHLCRNWNGRDLKVGDLIEEPLIVGGTLVSVSNPEGQSATWTFKGGQKQVTLFLPADDSIIKKYAPGGFYTFDMRNYCYSFLMAADSRYPSKYLDEFTYPEPL